MLGCIALVPDKDGDRSLNVEDAMGILARNLGKLMNSSGGRNQYGRQIAEEENVLDAMSLKVLVI